MKNDQRAVKIAWMVWGTFVVAYLALNFFCLNSSTISKEKVVLGFGIAMPIISNLAWWAVGFRLRFRINHWWAFGFLTSIVLGLAGVFTMWTIAKSAQPDHASSASAQRIPSSAALTIPPANPAPSPQGNRFSTWG